MTKRAGRGKKKRSGGYPQTEQDRLFCERWLIHFNAPRAWLEAGFKRGNGAEPYNKLERFAEYLRPIREEKARLIAEQLFIDADKVTRRMVGQAFYDPAGFVERAALPLTELVKPTPQAKRRVERPVLWDGKPVYGERLKPYCDLTPEQQAIVEVTGTEGGLVSYRLPSISERHASLTSIGRQFGLFAEKLIVERSNRTRVEHVLTFQGVPTAKLDTLKRQLLPLVGLEFAKQLGFTPEEREQAAREEGVIIEQTAKAPA